MSAGGKGSWSAGKGAVSVGLGSCKTFLKGEGMMHFAVGVDAESQSWGRRQAWKKSEG